MRRLLVLLVLLQSSLVAQALFATPENLDSWLSFEAGEIQRSPVGWGGGPPGTVFFEAEQVHAGKGAARIERDASSAGPFSSLTGKLEIDFGGQVIEMRGFLKTRGVIGSAGLWLRLDGPSGMVGFDNMQSQGLVGDTGWTEYSIQLRLDPRATSMNFGVLLSGEGVVWMDDLGFLVDGKPLAEAPSRVREETVLDTDQEFARGSKIQLEPLSDSAADKVKIENLKVLARVWGFLKYHHPRIASGELHWDFELFRILPKILAARDGKQRDRALIGWLDEIGDPAACEPCAEAPKEPYFAARLDWIDTLGPQLSARLRMIYQRRFVGADRFFVAPVPSVNNASFNHEPAYGSLTSIDVGYRLLALFRLWNIIEYWFPYRDLIEDDWPTVLEEFIPRLIAAASSDEYQLELLQFIVEIGDGHANLYSANGLQPPLGECFWPVAVRFIDGQATVAALGAGVEVEASKFVIGDVIQTIDGRAVAELIEEWAPYYPASNQPYRLRTMSWNVPRGTCGDAKVGLERRGKKIAVLATRLPDIGPTRLAHDRAGETFQRLSEDVAYLKLTGVSRQDVESYLEGATGSRGLVIDIRTYPSDFMVFALGGRLTEEITPFARFTVADPDNPGAFIWGISMWLPPAELRYAGKVAILVDESSISSSEYTAMAFRSAPNAVVIGSTTAGADGNVSPIPLPGGLRTGISGIGVFYPDKTPTQRVGIVPDIYVAPSIEGIRDGRDEVLEAALRHLLGPEADEAEIRRLAARP